jgi:hypothetical protein
MEKQSLRRGDVGEVQYHKTGWFPAALQDDELSSANEVLPAMLPNQGGNLDLVLS